MQFVALKMAAPLQKLMPDLSASDAKYMHAMLDADGDGHVTFDELMASIKQSMVAAAAIRDARQRDAGDVLAQLKARFAGDRAAVAEAFREADAGRSGRLEYPQLLRVVRKLLPAVTSKELQFLVSRLHSWDLDSDGTVTLSELYRALQVGTYRLGPPSAAAAGSRSRPASAGRTALGGGILFPGEASAGAPRGASTASPRGASSAALPPSLAPQQQRIPGGVSARDLDPALGRRLGEAEAELRKKEDVIRLQGMEIEGLRKAVADSQRALNEKQDGWLARDPAPVGHSDIDAQIKEAWDKANGLKARYTQTQSALDSLKDQNARVIKVSHTYR